MSLPPPSALLGIPRFEKWYPNQEQSFSKMLSWYQSDKRFLGVAISAGSGKSIMALLLAKLSGARTVILTESRGLQDQYCLAPDTKVITSDLRWVPIGSLCVGDDLLGFDEDSTSTSFRKWRKSTVTNLSWIVRPCYRLTFDDGTTVVCSSDHQWLTSRTDCENGVRFWRTTKHLRLRGKQSSAVIKLLDVWGDDSSREAGYLAAAFDGEGHFTQLDSTVNSVRGVVSNGVIVQLGFSQKRNGMLGAVEGMLRAKGFSFSESTSHPDDCVRLALRGRSHKADTIRFMGQIRPLRLLPKLNIDKLGAIYSKRECKLVGKEFVGDQVVVSVSTTTRTFVAEGLASHNCADCEPLGGVIMKGRQNYDCLVLRGGKADEGPCHLGVACSLKSDCPYQIQLQKALAAKIVVTNYAYYLAQTNYSSGLGEIGLLVADEANQSFNSLEGFMSLFITENEVKPSGVSFPSALALSSLSTTDQWPIWKAWADSALPAAKDYLSLIESQVKLSRASSGIPAASLLQKFKVAKSAVSKLSRIQSIDSNWVVQRFPHSVKFTPIWVAGYSKSLFRDVPKVMLMSATLSQKTADTLGVPADRDWLEVGSSFPPYKTPICHIPSARMSFRTDDYGSTIWAARIDQIISRRLDRKGIIFTVSYERARLLLERSRFKDIMVTHNSSNVFDVVTKFKVAPAPAILLSPTVTTGWDFPAESTGCRYAIASKLPWPDSRDEVYHARQKADKDWGAYLTMNTLAQSSARLTRGVNDSAEIFLTDDNARWMIFKYSKFAPKWFMARWKGSLSCVPEPLV